MCSYSYEELVEKVKMSNFKAPEAAQDYLKSLDASIVMAIRVTRSVFRISMGEAKRIIDQNPVWKAEVSRSSEVQKAALTAAEIFNAESELGNDKIANFRGPYLSM